MTERYGKEHQALRNILMNSDTPEGFFVFELFVCKTIGTDHGRALYNRVRDAARAELKEVLARSTPSSARAQQFYDMIENTPVDIQPFVPDPVIESDRARVSAFVSCRPLLSMFVSSFFDRPTPDSPFTLNAYYAAAGPGFWRELIYMYLLRVDETVRLAARVALHEAKDHFEAAGDNEEEDRFYGGFSWDDDGESATTVSGNKRKRIKFNPDNPVNNNNGALRTPREYYEIFMRPEGIKMESRCLAPIDDESKTTLGKLVLAIPLILSKWNELPIKEFCLVYRGVSSCSDKLNPMTPIGLYVHFQFFTPTHLRLSYSALLKFLTDTQN